MLDLVNASGRHRTDLASWHLALELARDRGWDFAGTRPPKGWRGGAVPPGELTGWPDLALSEPGGWDGNYGTAPGQRVSDEDGRALADALEHALDDVPAHDAREHKPQGYPMPRDVARLLRGLSGGHRPDPTQVISPLEWFSGKRKRELRRLIDFCRKGGFTIR